MFVRRAPFCTESQCFRRLTRVYFEFSDRRLVFMISVSQAVKYFDLLVSQGLGRDFEWFSAVPLVFLCSELYCQAHDFTTSPSSFLSRSLGNGDTCTDSVSSPVCVHGPALAPSMPPSRFLNHPAGFVGAARADVVIVTLVAQYIDHHRTYISAWTKRKEPHNFTPTVFRVEFTLQTEPLSVRPENVSQFTQYLRDLVRALKGMTGYFGPKK